MEHEINFENLESFSEKYSLDLETTQRARIVTQLVRLREGAWLTQKELSAEVGMTKEQLSNIEKGIQNPTLEEILTLANYFKHELTLNEISH